MAGLLHYSDAGSSRTWIDLTTRTRLVAWAFASVVFVVNAWPSLETVVDDAYITARFAEQLAGGSGLVYNAGQPAVEGFTNLAWCWLQQLG